VLMGAVILAGYWFLSHWFDVTGSALARLATLAVLVVAGLAGYLAALQGLGAVRLSDLVTAARRRL